MTSDYDVLSMYGVLVSDAEIAEWLWENGLDNLTGDDLEVARVKARYEIMAARSLETDGNQ